MFIIVTSVSTCVFNTKQFVREDPQILFGSGSAQFGSAASRLSFSKELCKNHVPMVKLSQYERCFLRASTSSEGLARNPSFTASPSSRIAAAVKRMWASFLEPVQAP